MAIWHSILEFAATPTTTYVFLLLGIYGILFECMNPGLIFPGVIGLLALILSIYGLTTIGVSWVGLTLFILGLVCLLLSLFIKRFGSLALLGIAGLFIGAYFMFDASVMRVGIGVIIFFTILTAAFFLVVMKLAVRSQKKPVITGGEDLIGQVAEVSSVSVQGATVKLLGESWTAQCSTALTIGDKVRIVKRNGLVLFVEKGE